jgi:hypothetical protein
MCHAATVGPGRPRSTSPRRSGRLRTGFGQTFAPDSATERTIRAHRAVSGVCGMHQLSVCWPVCHFDDGTGRSWVRCNPPVCTSPDRPAVRPSHYFAGSVVCRL